jgi:uncharacterized membrane protein YjjP (DUF1212 family)
METKLFDMPPDMDKVLRTALDLGEHLLINGADVGRVEDTVTRICKAYGTEHVEVFCIASLLQASVRFPDGRYCHQMRRIKSNGNNLARLEELNDISRHLCNHAITLDEASERVKAAKAVLPYRSVFYYIAAVLGSSAFCIFFGGSLRDGLSASVAAIPVMFMERHPIKGSSQMVHTIVEAFVGGIIANLLVLAGFGQNVNLVCIGVFMLLIPGIKFGFAMQDFVNIDVLAGSAKLVNALMLTVMIVLGLGVATMLFGRVAL